jgi:hypothetical protein
MLAAHLTGGGTCARISVLLRQTALEMRQTLAQRASATGAPEARHIPGSQNFELRNERIGNHKTLF